MTVKVHDNLVTRSQGVRNGTPSSEPAVAWGQSGKPHLILGKFSTCIALCPVTYPRLPDGLNFTWFLPFSYMEIAGKEVVGYPCPRPLAFLHRESQPAWLQLLLTSAGSSSFSEAWPWPTHSIPIRDTRWLCFHHRWPVAMSLTNSLFLETEPVFLVRFPHCRGF